MGSETTITIEQVTLDTAVPTELPFKALFTWVIWQYPRKRAGGLLGAVRPPTAEHGWFPAIIHNKTETVMVHGQVERPFDTPEAAIDYFS
jgi:hypothetical protein